MAKRIHSIPVITLPQQFDKGILVGKMSHHNAGTLKNADRSHRHDFHFFILLEAGECHMEIDFEKCLLKRSSVTYINPNQVHLLKKVKNAGLYVLAISNENIDAHYLQLLEEIQLAKPLSLKAMDFSILVQAIQLSTTLFERKQERLYTAALKDSCNALIGLIVSQYLRQTEPAAGLSRFDIITRDFKRALEVHFIKFKAPSKYAKILNISAPYLNECVKTVTGLPVSHHIQQRIILEAKRMLVHSDRSVKEIAAGLGYEDYPYFSRLFTKVAGVTALTFRNKNLE